MTEFFHALLVLLIIIPSIFMVTYFFKKYLKQETQNSASIKIVNHLPLSTKERIILLSVNQELLLIGVTANTISTLRVYDNAKPTVLDSMP